MCSTEREVLLRRQLHVLGRHVVLRSRARRGPCPATSQSGLIAVGAVLGLGQRDRRRLSARARPAPRAAARGPSARQPRGREHARRRARRRSARAPRPRPARRRRCRRSQTGRASCGRSGAPTGSSRPRPPGSRRSTCVQSPPWWRTLISVRPWRPSVADHLAAAKERIVAAQRRRVRAGVDHRGDLDPGRGEVVGGAVRVVVVGEDRDPAPRRHAPAVEIGAHGAEASITPGRSLSERRWAAPARPPPAPLAGLRCARSTRADGRPGSARCSETRSSAP